MAGGFLGSVFGSVPQIPNPTTTAGQAVAGNQKDLGNIGSLTLGTDAITAQGAQNAYLQNLPDYAGMLQQASGNVAQELTGQVPTDVANQIQTAAAERGIGSGMGAGSPNETASYLDSLGLTSLGEMQAGQQGFSSLMGSTPTGAQMNPTTMFTSPQDEQAAMTGQAYLNAAPNPVVSGILAMLASSTSMGGGMGGGGGGGASSMSSMASMF